MALPEGHGYVPGHADLPDPYQDPYQARGHRRDRTHGHVAHRDRPAPAPTAAAREKPHGNSGTTYYVDCLRGSDTSSGTSAGRPWRSLAKASRTYGPGDRLLLRRGTSCTGVLAPTGSGTAALPISVDAYGKGVKPRIDGAGARAAVLHPSGGILFSVTGSAVPTRFDGVRIEDSTVRHVDRTGIGTSTTPRSTATPSSPVSRARR
ncbi:hypothetical protein ACIQMR_29305 [Streptomyces sp. NPDC091376]|uniref:hypothetical protein n=1 Tax=Streptomyces sp. NPDC091376 TaxID=3365994 RepID=UPI00380E9F77